SRNRFSFSTASFDWMIATRYLGTAIAARIATSAITVTSSISVKPALPRASPGVVGGLSIERLGRALRVDVVDVLAAPRVAVGVVLVAAHPPLRAARHRVDRDPPQELQLPVERPHAVH